MIDVFQFIGLVTMKKIVLMVQMKKDAHHSTANLDFSSVKIIPLALLEFESAME